MQTFESPFSEHLDRFCSLLDIRIDPRERVELAALIETHLDSFELALWWSLSRLVYSRFGPHDVFPGRLCKRSIAEVIDRPSSTAMARLFDGVRDADPQGWQAAAEALGQLAAQTNDWTVWPDPSACERAATLLDALEQPWNATVERIRADSRAPDRKDAYRRAQGWRAVTTKLLRTSSSPRGSLRLLHEYLHGVCTQFRRSCPERELGSYELFVLEVVDFVNQLWMVEIDEDPQPPRSVEQQHPRRRKRIERARLRVFCRWEPDSNHVWTTRTLPTLLALAELG